MTIFLGLIHILLIDIDVVVAVAIVTPGIAKPSDKLHAAALFSIQLTANVFSANAIGKLIVPVPCVSVPTNPHCLVTDEQSKVTYVVCCIYFKACIIKDFGAHLIIAIRICNNYPIAYASKRNGIIFYFCCRVR